jgi:S-disulfanyl-L-cysteine oxidoreductase SoxD
MLEALLALLVVGGDTVAAPPDVGRVATAEQVRALDLSVFPNGAGLPKGRGTTKEGRVLYTQLCASCHGKSGEGSDDYHALIGGRGSLNSTAPVLTIGSYWPYATTIWDYIRRSMPYVAPGTLSTDQVYSLTAFLLSANGIIGEDLVLDERTLLRVAMPNRDGFVDDPRPDVGATRRQP